MISPKAKKALRYYARRYRTELDECLQEYYCRTLGGELADPTHTFSLRSIARFCRIKEVDPFSRRSKKADRFRKIPKRVPLREDIRIIGPVEAESEQCELVRFALEHLSQLYPRDAQLLRAYYGIGEKERTVEELADIYGWQIDTVKVKLSRAKEKLEDICYAIRDPRFWRER